MLAAHLEELLGGPHQLHLSRFPDRRLWALPGQLMGLYPLSHLCPLLTGTCPSLACLLGSGLSCKWESVGTGGPFLESLFGASSQEKQMLGCP